GDALELDRVFEDHQALGGKEIRDLLQERIDEGGLARVRATRDQNVLVLAHGASKLDALRSRDNTRRDVLVERIHNGGRLADGEGRGAGDGRDEPLQAAP